MKSHVVRELNPDERLLASQGHSLWTCDRPEPDDPLTPIEREVEREFERVEELEREIEHDIEERTRRPHVETPERGL